MNVELLKELGMDSAAENLGQKLDLKKKLTIAYEHFRFVEPSILDRFEVALKAKTLTVVEHNKYQRTEKWRRLKFVELKDYKEIPPPDCLLDLKKAKDMGCFDRFVVAKVEEVTNFHDTTPTPDPIIFGQIDYCADMFFITQWDDDVKIEDILNANEG